MSLPRLEFYKTKDGNINLTYEDWMHGKDVYLTIHPDSSVHERLSNEDGTEDEDGNTLTMPTERLEPRKLYDVLKAILERDDDDE